MTSPNLAREARRLGIMPPLSIGKDEAGALVTVANSAIYVPPPQQTESFWPLTAVFGVCMVFWSIVCLAAWALF